MEILIVIAIIVVVLIILGVSFAAIAKGMLIISAIVLVTMLLFFTVMAVMLLLSKKAEGEFDGFGKNEEGRFETAYYKIGEERLKNIFPAENILRGKIYSSGTQKLRRLKLGKNTYVIDRHSRLIIIAGLVATVPSLYLVTDMLSFINSIKNMLG